MTKRSLLLLPLATTLSLLAACGSEPERIDYPTLVGRFAEEAETPPLIADEAWLSDTDFYVRFRRGDEVRYGGGNWAGCGPPGTTKLWLTNSTPVTPSCPPSYKNWLSKPRSAWPLS